MLYTPLDDASVEAIDVLASALKPAPEYFPSSVAASARASEWLEVLIVVRISIDAPFLTLWMKCVP